MHASAPGIKLVAALVVLAPAVAAVLTREAWPLFAVGVFVFTGEQAVAVRAAHPVEWAFLDRLTGHHARAEALGADTALDRGAQGAAFIARGAVLPEVDRFERRQHLTGRRGCRPPCGRGTGRASGVRAGRTRAPRPPRTGVPGIRAPGLRNDTLRAQVRLRHIARSPARTSARGGGVVLGVGGQTATPHPERQEQDVSVHWPDTDG